ncbi:hypothetical protein HK100_008942, partial [Physocladia obscura]
MLGILTNGNREISLCLLSLFDDPNEDVRKVAAKSLAIRSLNNDPSQFHALNTSIVSSNAIHHREDGSCVFDDPKDACGVANWFRQNEEDGGGIIAVSRKNNRWVGLPMALKSPFKYLLSCLDDSVGLSDVDIKWQGSLEERLTFGYWAFHISQHIFSICPVLANSNIYENQKGIHLPTLSDPRQKAITKIVQDLLSRLEKNHPTVLVDDPFLTEQMRNLRHSISLISTGILEGSNKFANTTIPLCDHRVLRTVATLLSTLRHDETVLIRLVVIESLARILGVQILIDRVNQTGFAPSDIVQDLIPTLPQKFSKESIESLRIIYRLVRGGINPHDNDESKFALWGTEKYDKIEKHTKIEAIRNALLNYGETVHLHAVFKLGDFDATRFSKSHHLVSNINRGGTVNVFSQPFAEIPQIQPIFKWAHREEEDTEKRTTKSLQSGNIQQLADFELSHSYRDDVPEEKTAAPTLVSVKSSVLDGDIPHFHSSMLKNLATEEQKLMEEFNKQIQLDDLSLLNHHFDDIALIQSSQYKSHSRLSHSNLQNPITVPDAGEGASLLFKQTENYFDEALDLLESNTGGPDAKLLENLLNQTEGVSLFVPIEIGDAESQLDYNKSVEIPENQD